MIYVRQPTDEEHAELQRMTRQAVGRVSQRAQMVLLSAQRRTVPQIAAIFSMRIATVRQWLRRFDAEGPAGLYLTLSCSTTRLTIERTSSLWQFPLSGLPPHKETRFHGGKCGAKPGFLCSWSALLGPRPAVLRRGLKRLRVHRFAHLCCGQCPEQERGHVLFLDAVALLPVYLQVGSAIELLELTTVQNLCSMVCNISLRATRAAGRVGSRPERAYPRSGSSPTDQGQVGTGSNHSDPSDE